ncbi:hypothetical protein D6D85_03480 [Candidatus Methanodesulfokora washburnensis]|jgi:hypothetical protein|uniref:Uncharacterized protein n=1 Tax=Candidatus Methanodesulfokora washburnensis TaxID=2478471 RepID=A0A3R9PZ41_9CREN|nr:hypothetical protein D6D85_03480 [Candidatus Methanodesulfokores washburnensis]
MISSERRIENTEEDLLLKVNDEMKRTNFLMEYIKIDKDSFLSFIFLLLFYFLFSAILIEADSPRSRTWLPLSVIALIIIWDQYRYSIRKYFIQKE